MANGAFKKCNGVAWNDSQAKKFNATAASTGKIRHADAANWFDNYPSNALEEKQFNATWTHAYNKNWIQMDTATWGDHPRCGDANAGFLGMWGFNRDAMRDFVGTSTVTKIQITVYFVDPLHGFNPVCDFYPHVYLSKTDYFNPIRAFPEHKTTSQFIQTGADIVRTITLPASAWMGGTMGGVVVNAAQTNENSARFAGVTTSHDVIGYNTKLLLQVQR